MSFHNLAAVRTEITISHKGRSYSVNNRFVLASSTGIQMLASEVTYRVGQKSDPYFSLLCC